ncbi:MAG TPA: FAD-dependent oxidoreductase, partial [Phnomibacter sp.]|nr:FAD-dependent oxidoreductase [Phnomibacter sp.]
GVVFRCNTNVGTDVSTGDLLREFQAIVLAGGSTIPRDLPAKGREAKGVYYAMQFLKQQNKRVANPEAKLLQERGFAGSQWTEEISAAGKHVVVIGGGDTGSDCVGTSNRQGAASVTQFELLPQPPVSRTAAMPWPTYPMLLKTTSSHDEGCDRKWAVATKEFVADEKGVLKSLRIVDLEWELAPDGRPVKFSEIAGSEREIPCDLALLAMGFVHPQQEGVISDLELELDERGNVKASEQHFQTALSKVFACGDMRRGQSLVVWAISEGRECARKVDEFLMGSSLLETKENSILFNFI